MDGNMMHDVMCFVSLFDLQRFEDYSFSLQRSQVVTRKTFVGIFIDYDDDFLVTSATTYVENETTTFAFNEETAGEKASDVTTVGNEIDAPTIGVTSQEKTSTWPTSDGRSISDVHTPWSFNDAPTTTERNSGASASEPSTTWASDSTAVASTSELYTESSTSSNASEHFTVTNKIDETTLQYKSSTVNDRIYFPSD